MSRRAALLSTLLVAAVFGGSFALNGGGEEQPARAQAPGHPATAPDVGSASLRTDLLGSARAIPALRRPPAPAPAASPPAPSPAPEPAPAPAPAPAPSPAPAPAPAPSPAPDDSGQTFDDSG